MEIASSSIRTGGARFTKRGLKSAASSQKLAQSPGSVPTSQKVSVLKPKSWIPFDPSFCKSCRAGCCTLPVQVTTEDLFHMGFLESHQVNASKLAVFKQLSQQGILKSYSPKKQWFTLQQKNGNDCIFLDAERRCTIYEKRPSICRRFPENSIRPGFCPGQKK